MLSVTIQPAMSRPAPPAMRPADMLPELHRRLLEVTGGVSSVLLRQNSSGEYKAVSGRGFAASRGRLADRSDPPRLVDQVMAVGAPAWSSADTLAELVDRLGAPGALLIPVQSNRSRTVLAVGVGAGRDPPTTRRPPSRPGSPPRSRSARWNGRFACIDGCASCCCCFHRAPPRR